MLRTGTVAGRQLHRRVFMGLALAMLAGTSAAKARDHVETIIFARHGDKPEQTFGRHDCQGINRAIYLPGVILRMFGKPDAIFAPDPSTQISDTGQTANTATTDGYMQPLMTVIPAATGFGLPLHADIAVNDIAALQRVLDKPDYRDALILVGWEHKFAEEAARNLLAAHGGDADLVPEWQERDFDSLYVVTITRSGASESARFAQRRQGMDDPPSGCPFG